MAPTQSQHHFIEAGPDLEHVVLSGLASVPEDAGVTIYDLRRNELLGARNMPAAFVVSGPNGLTRLSVDEIRSHLDPESRAILARTYHYCQGAPTDDPVEYRLRYVFEGVSTFTLLMRSRPLERDEDGTVRLLLTVVDIEPDGGVCFTSADAGPTD